ncbi:nitroreductase family protein [Burkholderia pseudomallei]|nr:nitroreductase family protein [Burkholderia pseudomallei]VCD31692.1 nitroreductase family protein [Burkholderia pseudomallei]VCD39242.1 nitroreductase family protein [Burkholderia pseudomallei]VCD46663.1 nitroreductase family protein [Burkholderia pseudomallei]VCD74548.1 nitroreductase family protein [Burkholderia pseudomallei]
MDGRRGRSRTARRAPGEIGWVRGAVGRRYSSSAVQQFSSSAVQQFSSSAVQQFNRSTVQPFSRSAVQPSSDSAIQRFSDSAKNNRMARTHRRSTHAKTPPARGEARPKYGCDAGKDRACIGAFATAMSAARRLVRKIADATSQRDEAAPPQRLRSAEARVKSSPPCGGGAPPYHPGAGARDAARAKPRAGGARETIAPAAARAACTVAPPPPSFRPGARARRATLTRSRSAGAPDRRAAPAPSRRWWPPARRARRTRARAR